MDLVVKIALGVALGALLFFGGCVLLIGYAINDKDDAPAAREYAAPKPVATPTAQAQTPETAVRGLTGGNDNPA